MQVNSGSYDGIVDDDINITSAWDRYVGCRAYPRPDHPRGHRSVLVVQLGQAKQTIDLWDRPFRSWIRVRIPVATASAFPTSVV